MAYSIKWSPKAADHFEEICAYISKDSNYYAVLFAKRIVAIVKAFPQFPKSGRVCRNILKWTILKTDAAVCKNILNRLSYLLG